MGHTKLKYSVFTKPWRTPSVSELAEKVQKLGFDGIEFPLREGYQLNPENAEKGLPQLARQLADYGLKIYSVASTTDERVFAGCAEAGVEMIRVMTEIRAEEGYVASERREQAYLNSLIPLCEKYNVKVGVQQHYGDCVIDAAGLRTLLEGVASDQIGAIWDAAHDALTGQRPEYGLDMLWNRLVMVNFKNAFYRRVNGPEAEIAEYERYFTLGSQGMASWSNAAQYLIERQYEGVITLTAQYDDEERVDQYLAEDLIYAKTLFAQ